MDGGNVNRKDKVPRNKSYFPYAVIAGLSAILIVLAVLQYRWSDQVSQAERDRMKASLRIATTQFRQDFSRELQAVSSGLQPDPELLTNLDWDGYAAQSADWLKSSNDPELVAAVYLWLPDRKLLRLDRTARRFDPAEQPAALQPVIERISGQTDNGRQGRGFRPQAWSMDGNVPALFRGGYSFHDADDHRQPKPPTLVEFTIVLLNGEYIQTKLLPDLAARHFAGPDGFLYQVGVFTAGDASRPIYRSGPGLDKLAIASADVTMDLVDVRPRQPPDRQPPDRQQIGPPPRFGGPPRGPGNAAARSGFNFQERLRQARRVGAAPQQPIVGDARSAWELVVRHRAGSVDAAVAELRLKNLAVSFAILLILGVSMALIVIGTQRAQRLARLQVEFVAGVSHELRTPLAVISSAAENLTDGIVEGKQQVARYGALIRNEARRLEGMMEHILEFASGQKRRTYDPKLLSVNELIDQAVSFCSAAIQEAGFIVEKHVEAGLAPVLAEEHGLLQCLQNLIVNAVKYGGNQRWIGIDARMDAASVAISVADRGMGIDEEDLPHVFDAFYRGRAATEAQIHGTGLGLSLAKSFVQAAGGTLSVKSKAGEGACFTVRLPAAKPALTASSQVLAGRTV